MQPDSPSECDPQELSVALRHATGPEMRNRRWIAGLSIFSGAIMGGIGLFQLGIVRDLPEPSWPGFDAKKVNGSAQAYSILKTPDALLGAISYAITAALAGMSGPERSRTAPLTSLAMGAKLAVDAGITTKLTTEQWTRYHAFCLWCLLAAGATFTAAALGIPEVLAASRHLRAQSTAE